MTNLFEDILIRLKAKDETGSTFTGISGKISAMKIVGVAAATAVGAEMLSFSKNCVQSAMDAEQGWNAYNSALERVGMGSSTQLSQMKSKILDLASTLGRGTADVRQATTDFMNYGVSAEEAMKGASAASAIAAAKNMDYASAENVIMSALKGRGTQLKALGLDIADYKDSTTGAIDTTRLFADITTKYGGNQAKYSKSAAAQQQRLTNSINAFKTSLGQALLPIIEAVTPLITQFARALANNPLLTDFTAGVIALGGALGLLSAPLSALQTLSEAGLFSKIGSGIKGVGKSLSNLGSIRDSFYAYKERPDLFDNSIFAKIDRFKEKLSGAKTTAIDGLKSSITSLKNKLSEFGSKAVQVGKKLPQLFKSGVSSGISRLQTALSTLKGKLSEIGSKAVQAGSKLSEMVKSGVSKGITGLKTALSGLKTVLLDVKDASIKAGQKLLLAGKNALIAGYNAAKSAVMWVAEKTQKLLSAAASYALSTAQTVLNVVMSLNPITIIIIALIALVAILVVAYMKVGWFREMVNNFGKTLMQIGQQIWSFFASIPSKITSFLQQAYNTIINIGKQIINFYVSFYSTIIRNIISFLTGIVTTIRGFASKLFMAGFNIGRRIRSGLINVLSGIISKVKGIFNSIVSTITGFAKTVYNAALGVGKNIYNGIVNGLGSVGKIASGVLGMGGAGGVTAGSTYTGNKKTSALSIIGAGNPKYTPTAINKQNTTYNANSTTEKHTYVFKEGAVPIDARNLTTHEAKQTIISALEGLGSPNTGA